MADVRAQVFLPFGSEFGEDSAFTPSESGTQALGTVFDQVVAWSQALRPLREHGGPRILTELDPSPDAPWSVEERVWPADAGEWFTRLHVHTDERQDERDHERRDTEAWQPNRTPPW